MSEAPKTITSKRWAYHPEDMDDIGNALVTDHYTLTSSVSAQLKAADELAEAVENEREMVCQDMALQQQVSDAVAYALAEYRKAKEQAQ